MAAITPPSIRRSVPVINFACSPKRNAPASAISSEVPVRIAANNDHLFLNLCFFNPAFRFVSDHRIHCTAHLPACKVSPDTSLVAANTSTDFIGCPGIDREAVIAVGFQQLCNFNRFLQCPSCLFLSVKGRLVEILHIAFQGKAHGDGIICPRIPP